jgi:MoxR-like ATPase
MVSSGIAAQLGGSEPKPVRNEGPENYVASAALDSAVEVALLLGKPLLVTGEAGSGKTQLAEYVRWKQKLEYPTLKFETKSTSCGQDLFYSYNTLARFHDAQTARISGQSQAGKDTVAPPSSAEYITYRALGEAILRTNPYENVKEWLPSWMASWSKPHQSVVLIDEVDKAPLDFPNDILNEIEYLYFRIAELRNREVSCGTAKLRPIMVLTSNSEKTLPEPFLRRCVYFHIDRPSKTTLQKIATNRIVTLRGQESKLLDQALEIFLGLQDERLRLDKRPGTAELLDWLIALTAKIPPGTNLLKYDYQSVFEASLAALIKGENDPARAKAWLVERKWLKPATSS